MIGISKVRSVSGPLAVAVVTLTELFVLWLDGDVYLQEPRD